MSIRAPGHEPTAYFQLWIVSSVSEVDKTKNKKL